MFGEPNCAQVFCEKLPSYDVRTERGTPLDGVASHMTDFPEDRAFRVAQAPPADVGRVLREAGADVGVSYLPVS